MLLLKKDEAGTEFVYRNPRPGVDFRHTWLLSFSLLCMYEWVVGSLCNTLTGQFVFAVQALELPRGLDTREFILC